MSKANHHSFYIVAMIVLISIAICTHATAVNAQQEQTARPMIDEIDDGYKISFPNEVARSFPDDRDLVLTVRHPDGSVSAIVGRASAASEGGIELRTKERLRQSAAEHGSTINIFDPSGASGARSCLAPEHGIGCFLAGICIGTTFCLPGGDPDNGGFTCECI